MGVRHYLSQTYLRGFSVSGNNNKIYCYDKKVKSFITSYTVTEEKILDAKKAQRNDIKPGLISKLGCKPDNFWTSEIENRMGKIETPFFEILKGINDKTIVNNRGLYDKMIQFITLQILRCKVSQNSFDSRVISDRDGMIKEYGDVGTMEEYILKEYTPKNIRKEALDNFLHGIEDKTSNVGNNLRNRTLKIYTIDNGKFLTGDFPFFHFYKDIFTEYPTIFFPISENIILQFGEKIERGEILFESSSGLWSGQAIIDMNRNFFNRSERYVFSFDTKIIQAVIV